MIRLVIIFLVMIITIKSNAQWLQQPSGVGGGHHLYSIFMLDENTGWTGGGTSASADLLKTTNGGVNWYPQTLPASPGFGGISGIYFIDANTGMAVDGIGAIIKTVNAGNTWVLQRYNLGYQYNDVYIVDSNTSYAVGNAIFKTTNGGNNWNLIYDPPPANNQTACYFFDVNTGIVIGHNAYIIRTTDGGTSWQQITANGGFVGDSTLFALNFRNLQLGFTGGSNGIFLKTTNGGLNWTRYQTGTFELFHGISFPSDDTGTLVAGSGRIFKTTNQGINWYQQASGVTDPLEDVKFVNNNTGWVAGFNGVILKTTNGGGPPVGIQPVSNEIPNSFNLFQNYPNPFNPVTKIRFEVPLNKGGDRGLSVKLIIYDLLGREVTTLVNEQLKPGSYETEWDGSSFASGIYFYSLVTDDPSTSSGQGFTETKRMVLIK